MNFISKFVKKEKNEKKAIENLSLNYTRKSFLKNLIRTIDIFIRYKQTIKKAKRQNIKIIIFDRYFYDTILQSKIDFLSKLILKIAPKPDKLFFLHLDPKKIFMRKGERSPNILKEQSDKLRREIKGISKTKEIETKTEKQTLEEILEELNNRYFLGCL